MLRAIYRPVGSTSCERSYHFPDFLSMKRRGWEELVAVLTLHSDRPALVDHVMHTTDRGLPAERHPCSLLMNAEQLRACRARLQRSSVTGGTATPGTWEPPACERNAARCSGGCRGGIRIATQQSAGMPSLGRETKCALVVCGRGRCFRASLEANATTKPRSPAALCRVS